MIDDGVQIINTDPYNPTNASHVTKGASYPKFAYSSLCVDGTITV